MRRPASGATRLTPEEITSGGFASAFRGVSETEVRNFLRRVADELAHGARPRAEPRGSGSPTSRSSSGTPRRSTSSSCSTGWARRPPGCCARPRRPPPTSARAPRSAARRMLAEANETADALRDEADAHATERHERGRGRRGRA